MLFSRFLKEYPVPNSETVLNSNPGKYYIGDPCYIIKDDLWDEFCNLLFKNKSFSNARNILIEINLQNTKILTGSTYYGDGLYRSDCCNLTIPVDAGLIALVELTGEAIDSDKLKLYSQNIVLLDEGFESSLSEGVFHFEKYRIDTKDHDNEDYSEDENFDEEDE